MTMTQATPPASPAPRRPRRRWLFRLLAVTLSLLLSFALMEGLFRILEWRELAHSSYVGTGGVWLPDARWGWKPQPGAFKQTTSEFVAEGNVSDLFMNDRPILPADAQAIRILALGDSHTYAVGASWNETWPHQLELLLNTQQAGERTDRFRVYNAGCVGYSLHQYLHRLIDQGPRVKPNYVVVGFSFATDLYDLLPPDRGGWIYGDDKERDYFDFDANGQLVEKHWAPNAAGPDAPRGSTTSAASVRQLLGNFATFRYLRRSKLALWVGSKLRLGGQSLWPNMEVVVNREISPEHEYQWKLAQALLLRMRDESKQQGAELIVLGIPYLPQVYDDVWAVTFASNPNCDRDASRQRLAAWCAANGIRYVDSCDLLRQRSKAAGRLLHHAKDAHPTPEGQKVIAEAVVQAGVIQPKKQAATPAR